jgi:hypothetical protein
MAVKRSEISLVYCGTLIHLAMALTVSGKCFLKKYFSIRKSRAGLKLGCESKDKSFRCVYTKEGGEVGSE